VVSVGGTARNRLPRFASSKFVAPTPAATWVARPDLCHRLDDGGDTGLSLVIGSPGSGKTSLLAQWCHASGADATCWVSADHADLDPVRFWCAFISAVRQSRPWFADECLDLLTLDDRVDHDLLEGLLTAAEDLDGTVTVVIDDFQFVGTAVHDHLRFLLSRGLGSLRLIIGTRVEPAIGLDRLRLEGRLCELREADLRFDRGAADRLLHNLGADLGVAEVEAVLRRTEGWAAGLHLAALALRDLEDPEQFVERFSASRQIISQYLWTEVYEAQSVDFKRFLLDTCIVDALSPGLAAALSPGTPVSLLDVESANLFVTRLDPDGQLFRYHQLFADMMRIRLRATAPDHELVLHERAAAWHVAHHDAASAFRHRWRAGQRTEAISSIHGRVLDAYVDSSLPQLTDIERSLTDDDVLAAPGPAVSFSLTLSLAGFFDEAERLASRVESMAASRLSHDDWVQLLAVRTFSSFVLGDTGAAVRFGGRLLGLAEPDRDETPWFDLGATVLVRAHIWEEDASAADQVLQRVRRVGPSLLERAETRATLAQLRLVTGELTECLSHARAAIADVEREGPEGTELDLLPRAVLGNAVLEQGDIAAAEELLTSVSERNSRSRVAACMLAKVALSRIWRADGNFESALVLLDEAQQLARRRPPGSGLLDHVRAQQARILDDLDDFGSAAAIIEVMSDGVRRNLTIAHHRLAQGDLEQARLQLESVEASAHTPRQRLDSALGRVQWSLVVGESLEGPAATVLELASAEGFLFPIAEAGAGVLSAVQQVARQRPRTRYVDNLQRAHPAAVAPSAPSRAFAVDALSERERAVLRYMATSLSYSEIAADLYVSPNTIRTHVKNITRKLQVNSRAEAIRRGHELRYL
jgi:LuxR family maltose regulon positive regulatory protein